MRPSPTHKEPATIASNITLILGGARSGKSRHAEARLAAYPPPWIYLATAQAFDPEMHDRIAQHRARRSADWNTIETPIDVASALTEHANAPVLVDCLTLWLTNLILAEADIESATAALESALKIRTAPTVLVTSEVGLGIVPDNALARRFRDAAGILHQRLAAQANHVILMVAGLPLTVK
jgi:adenosylcobinamide kinase/adenosylcobinamide-phosphate guanylyltransferase